MPSSLDSRNVRVLPKAAAVGERRDEMTTVGLEQWELEQLRRVVQDDISQLARRRAWRMRLGLVMSMSKAIDDLVKLRDKLDLALKEEMK